MAHSAVLFDLDGTLADTAPDLGYALNRQRIARGMPELPIEAVRAHASSGARGLLKAGFNLGPEDPGYEAMREEFLDIYAQNLARESDLFPGMASLLGRIEAMGLRWGIVTNKAERFTLPLLRLMGLFDRAAVVVCGDTTPHAKPHPAPLLAAMEKLALPAAGCLYVGDDERDVRAGQAAGMPVIVARYGYLGSGTPPEAWGADGFIDSPMELLAHLR
ncbi:MAG TPA: HAD-IA family hydrolase [Burkholderiales bacterium]|jgi:phosphoglycolate phosphatase|nr:HAD-IA family hydrolase [Burkholderiales bacterium]